ncbi:MAG: hypothetical protein EOM23_07210, partial [Candidatus Moranbacteria bacterium]|nr:hypothetical protein [Candidatus Moranbacteria bacterium]
MDNKLNKDVVKKYYNYLFTIYDALMENKKISSRDCKKHNVSQTLFTTIKRIGWVTGSYKNGYRWFDSKRYPTMHWAEKLLLTDREYHKELAHKKNKPTQNTIQKSDTTENKFKILEDRINDFEMTTLKGLSMLSDDILQIRGTLKHIKEGHFELVKNTNDQSVNQVLNYKAHTDKNNKEIKYLRSFIDYEINSVRNSIKKLSVE